MALSGCDVVLGLQERVDAGPILPDAKTCFEHDFPGVELDLTIWDELPTLGGVFTSTNSDLIFRVSTQAVVGATGVRTKVAFDVRNGAIVGQMVEPPRGDASTALVLARTDNNTAAYSAIVTPDQILHYHVGGVEVGADPLAGGHVRIRNNVNEVVFGTSTDGVVFAERAFPASAQFDSLKLQVNLGVSGAIPLVHEVKWNHVNLVCP